MYRVVMSCVRARDCENYVLVGVCARYSHYVKSKRDFATFYLLDGPPTEIYY